MFTNRGRNADQFGDRNATAQREARKGVKGVSPLFDLANGFDVIEDVPMEPMHLLCEGVVKLMLS